tara:strand:- start:816 stop:1448 length:633 start_codon:yes stop_codon:yes gene_type:complete
MEEYCSQEYFKKMLDSDSDEEDEIGNCLISHEKLEENKVKLSCGHTFNYLPLYKEIYYQKKHRNPAEVVRLRVNQIKCPYCRTIHNYLIPYKKMENVSSIYGVNSPSKYCYYENVCEYVYKRGAKKGENCGIRCVDTFCKTHMKYKKENTIGSTNISKVSKEQCNYVLKRGPNKGKKCENTILIKGDTVYKTCSKHKWVSLCNDSDNLIN